jgi:hypothetical protein
MDAAVNLAIQNFAENNGLDPAGMKAVAFVESGGVFFWIVNGKQVPAYRHEGHYFYRILKREKPELLQKAVDQGLANPTAGVVKNPTNWTERYKLFERCKAIDEGIAIRSASWGVGQVMGDNYDDLGYGSPESFYQTVLSGVEGQLDVMYKFITYNHLDDEIERQDWAGFAKGYNGSNYRVNNYDKQLAKAYAMFNGHPDNGGVMLVQQKLASLGLYNGKIDGLKGTQTSLAITAFQEKVGLKPDGIAGSVTIEKLDEYIAAKKSSKTRSLIPSLAGAGAITAGGVPKLMDAVSSTQLVADQSKGLLETIGVSEIAITVVVAIVVIIVLGSLLRRVHTDEISKVI